MPRMAQIKCISCENYFNVPTKPAPATLAEVTQEDRTPEHCSECKGSLRETVQSLLYDARLAEEHLDNVPDFSELTTMELWDDHGVSADGVNGRRVLDLVSELQSAGSTVGWIVTELENLYFKLTQVS